jgi:hypothetical protein
MRAAARGYARAGLAVLGLLPQSKRPRLRGGYKSATVDAATIAEHWERYPFDNVGIRPGPDQFIVDEDPQNGGDRELARQIRRRGALPETWTARTCSGGRHYWFTVADLGTIRGRLCQGVDIKHGGTGFVVVPPSIGPNGQRYEWLIPPEGAPAVAPLWLRLAIQPPPSPPRWSQAISGNIMGTGEYTLQCLAARIAAAPVSRRNITVYGAMKDALAQGDLDAFEPVLIDAAQACGLPDSEIATICRSARRGGVT